MKLSMAGSPQWVVFTLMALLGLPLLGFAEDPFTPLGAVPPTKQVAGWTEIAAEPVGVDSSSPAPTSALDSSDCPNKWSFRVIPYAWALGLHGDLTVNNVTAGVDASIGKVLNILANDINFAAIGQVEASNGQWGVIFNGVYADVSPGTQVHNLDFSSHFAMSILDLTATYEFKQVPEALCLPQGSRFEVLAGVRYISLSAGLTVTGVRGDSASRSDTEDWFDPIIGSRLRVPLSDRVTAQVRGDIGGFNIGDASRFTWNIEATTEFRCNERCSLFAGYRWLDIDRVSGSGNRRFGFDMNLNGPLAGIAFGF
jgi:hypothetical protein